MFVGTLCASFIANVVINPLDVVKSRIQNMPRLVIQSCSRGGGVCCILTWPTLAVAWFSRGIVFLSLSHSLALSLSPRITSHASCASKRRCSVISGEGKPMTPSLSFAISIGGCCKGCCCLLARLK
jgi:hypothetical protein